MNRSLGILALVPDAVSSKISPVECVIPTSDKALKSLIAWFLWMSFTTGIIAVTNPMEFWKNTERIYRVEKNIIDISVCASCRPIGVPEEIGPTLE